MPKFLTPDGLSLYYEKHGRGEAIVFVHEFGGDYRSWWRQVPAFSETHHCIVYSARGFLPSAVPESQNAYGQAQATADLLALLDGLQIQSAHLVGTSMGSFTSLDFALDHPGRVKSLTLVGNSSGPRNDAERRSYRDDWVAPEIERRLAEGGEGAVAVLAQDPAYRSFREQDPAGWQRYSGHLRAQPVEGAVNILKTLHWNRRSLWDDQDRLAVVTCPVMLIMGAEDYYLVGETNAFLDEVLPNSRRHCFDETGHLVNIERAEAFNALLREFLSSVAV